MDMEQYINRLDCVPVKRFTVKGLEKRKKQRERKRNFILSAAVCAVLIGGILSSAALKKGDPFTISVYAADSKIISLSDEPVEFDLSSLPDYIDYFPDEGKGQLNINLFFRLEGENIDEVTISCAKHRITRNNLKDEPVYFVENLERNTSDDYQLILQEMKDDESFLRQLTGSDKTYITKLVGASYTVPYEKQEEKQYGLVMNTAKGTDGTFSIGETILDVIVQYQNGRTGTGKIKIAASDDISRGIVIRLL